MAFMMPVMKNNYDIYKDSRSRKTSECSNGSNSAGGPTTVNSVVGIPHRQRKVSECKSESFATSPSHTYRMQLQRCQSSRAFPRNSSRASHSSIGGAISPTRSSSQGASPPKTLSSTSSSAGTSRNVTRNMSSATNATSNGVENSSDISKFHLRLVEKLRKSFRKDSGKRS